MRVPSSLSLANPPAPPRACLLRHSPSSPSTSRQPRLTFKARYARPSLLPYRTTASLPPSHVSRATCGGGRDARPPGPLGSGGWYARSPFGGGVQGARPPGEQRGGPGSSPLVAGGTPAPGRGDRWETNPPDAREQAVYAPDSGAPLSLYIRPPDVSSLRKKPPAAGGVTICRDLPCLRRPWLPQES